MWLERDDTKRKAAQGCNRMRRCGMPADRARLWSRRPDDRRFGVKYRCRQQRMDDRRR